MTDWFEINERIARKYGNLVGGLGHVTPDIEREPQHVERTILGLVYNYNRDATPHMIEAIKAVRQFDPTMGLKEAKDFVQEDYPVSGTFNNNDEAFAFFHKLSAVAREFGDHVSIDFLITQTFHV